MVWMVARTTSAARRTGGVGFTVEPAVLACGSAERSQLTTDWRLTPRREAASRRGSQPCGASLAVRRRRSSSLM